MYRLIRGARPLVRRSVCPSVTLCIAKTNNYNRSVEILVGLTKRRKPINLVPEAVTCVENLWLDGKTRLKSQLREGKNTWLGKNSKYFVYWYTRKEHSEKPLRLDQTVRTDIASLRANSSPVNSTIAWNPPVPVTVLLLRYVTTRKAPQTEDRAA
jgi:hypothetical protein